MKEIIRTCCVCKKKQDKKSMIRITLVNDEVYLDNLKQKTGKGCYVCNDNSCKTTLISKKILNRVYKLNISQEIYNKLFEELNIAEGNNSKN